MSDLTAGIGIKSLIFIALVTGTTLMLRPIQINLHARMGEIRDNVILGIEKDLGRKIQYGSMGPSIFGVLDIRNIRILREDGSTFLGISRLRLSYSFVKLLGGKALDAFHSVRIDSPVLSLDLEKDADLLRLVEARSAPDKLTMNFQTLLPTSFSLRIRNGEWEFTASSGRFSLQRFALDASVNRDRIGFQSRWSAAGALAGFEAAMTGQINGEYLNDRGEGSATLQIPTLQGDYFSVSPLTIQLSLKEKKLEILKTRDGSAAELALAYDLEDRSLAASFTADGFSPGNLLVFTGPLSGYNSVLAFSLFGNAQMEMHNSGSLGYGMNFFGTLPGNSSRDPNFLNLRAMGDEHGVSIDWFNINSHNGNLSFQGSIDFLTDYASGRVNAVAPQGHFSLSNFSLRGGIFEGQDIGYGINGDFTLSTQGRQITLNGENISAGEASLSAFDAYLYLEESGLEFMLAAETDAMAQISLNGFMDYSPRYLQIRLIMDSFCAGDILSFMEPLTPLVQLPEPARSAADDILLGTEFFFSTDYENVYYNAPRFAAAYEGAGDILVTASASGTHRGLELSELRIAWETGAVDVSASVDFSNPDDISFSLVTGYRDLSYLFMGMIMDRRDVNVRGSYGFQMNVSRSSTGSFSGFAQGDDIPIPSGNSHASLNFLASLYYVSPSLWQAGFERFEITGLSTKTSPSTSLSFYAAANENGIRLPAIRFDDGRGALEGSFSLDWNGSYSHSTFIADFFGSNGREYYSLRGEYQNRRLDIDLYGLGMQLSRVVAHNAVADGSIRFFWESAKSFSMEAALTSFTMQRQNELLRASAEASVTNDILSLRQMNISYSGIEASIQDLTVNRVSSLAQTEGFIQGSLSRKPVDISFRGQAAFNSSENWLDLLLGLEFLEGSLLVDTARFGSIQSDEPFSFIFSGLREREGLALDLSGGPKNMLRFRYSPESEGGSVYAAFSAPSPVRGSFAGLINSKTLDIQGPDIYVDLNSLWRFLPPDIVVAFPQGIVSASVRIAGPLTDPEFFGIAQGSSVHIVIPDFLPEPIRPAPVTFLLTGSEMTFGPVEAAVGRGRGTASAWFRFEQWIPNIFSIDIQVPPESPIPYAVDMSGVLAHGLASGRLNVGMEDLVLSITGDLTAHATEISLNSNEFMTMEGGQIFAEQNTVTTTVTDLSIRSGRRVEFFWPSVEFPILQAIADMGTGIRITSDQEARRFSLTGDLRLRGGEIFYLERNFYIREGTVFFNETESSFDPRISARAEIRDQNEDGPVTIALIIDNAPLLSFTPRFESSPPLSQMEIYSLLGHMPHGDEGPQRNLAAGAAIDSLAQFTVMRRLQRTARDILGLDMLSVRTQVFQNVVLQAAGSQQYNTNPDVDRPYRVGNYFDNTTVFIGKHFGADIFGQAMLTIKYDENKVDMGGIVLEPELGIEMRNPLFDIRFSMMPLHPENWFINDISFSVIWRRSF